MSIAPTTRPIAATDATRAALAEFVRRKATATARELGFSWVGTPRAPSTYQQLRSAFEHSATSGDPLPISNQFCDDSIYPTAEHNVMFRFWHDVSHVRRGLSFGLEDELELALWHLSELESAGFARGGEVHRVFEADLVGQVLLFALIRRFPINQLSFVQRSRTDGLFPGLLAEIRRLP